MIVVLNILAFIGASVVAVFVAYLAFVFGRELRHIHRVAKDYHRTAPNPDSYIGETNYFTRIQDGLNKDKERLYRVERKASNIDFSLSLHVKDNKHTKTAKAVKNSDEIEAKERIELSTAEQCREDNERV